MTDHLLISLEFSFFLSLFIYLLGGLSMTDHLLILLEFSFFLSLFLYSLLGGLSSTDYLLFFFQIFFLYQFLFLPYTFLCARLLKIDLVNFLQISVSHQAL